MWQNWAKLKHLKDCVFISLITIRLQNICLFDAELRGLLRKCPHVLICSIEINGLFICCDLRFCQKENDTFC